jgi:hypothetical protein
MRLTAIDQTANTNERGGACIALRHYLRLCVRVFHNFILPRKEDTFRKLFEMYLYEFKRAVLSAS